MTATDLVPASNDPRLRRAAHVRVHEPVDPEGAWVVQLGDDQYVRIGADAARLLAALDGRPAAELAASLGPPWSPALVNRVLDEMENAGLVGDHTPPRPAGRVHVVPPLTVQFAVVKDASRLLRPIARVLRALPMRRVGQTAVLLAAAGAVALLAQLGAVADAVGSPARPAMLATVAALLAATNVAHELGHAMTLVAYGGRPRRLGFMIFYLAPAFFCDVSDAWRLPTRQARVAVALAGPAVQFGAGAVAALLAVRTAGDARWVLLVFGVASYLQGAVNLLPLLKFDGYIALMSWLDTPFVRQRAIATAQDAVGSVVFGGRRPPAATGWQVWYGLGCMAAPVIVVANVLAILLGVLSPLGAVAAGGAVAAVVFFAVRVARATRTMARRARQLGATAPRIALGLAAAAGGLAAAAAVPVDSTVPAVWFSDHGRTFLALPPGLEPDALQPGQRVTLQHQGVAFHQIAGHATVAATAPEERDVPLPAVAPVEVDGTVRMTTLPLTPSTGAEGGGIALVRRAPQPLLIVLANRLAGPVIGYP